MVSHASKPRPLGICNSWLNTPEIQINKMTGKYKCRKFTEAVHETEKISREQTNTIILHSRELPTRYPSTPLQTRRVLQASRTPCLSERWAGFPFLSKSSLLPPSSTSRGLRYKLLGGLGPKQRQEALHRHLDNKAVIFSCYRDEILI